MTVHRSRTMVVSGYASVDYALHLAPFGGLDATTIVRRRAEEWPRVGGVAHVTRAAALASAQAPGKPVNVTALSWIGHDPEGQRWSRSVEAAGASLAGVVVQGSRTPSSHLLYPEDDGTICLFDPADCHPEHLTDAQRDIAATADLAVMMIGPVGLTHEVLDALPPSSAVLWIVKQDPASLSEELVTRISARAGVITLSAGEQAVLAAVVQAASVGTLIVITHGVHGAELLRVRALGEVEVIGSVPAHPVAGVDATGAGDTFSGTLAVRLALRSGSDSSHSPDAVPDSLQVLEDIAAAAKATAHMLQNRRERLSPHSNELMEKEST